RDLIKMMTGGSFALSMGLISQERINGLQSLIDSKSPSQIAHAAYIAATASQGHTREEPNLEQPLQPSQGPMFPPGTFQIAPPIPNPERTLPPMTLVAPPPMPNAPPIGPMVPPMPAPVPGPLAPPAPDPNNPAPIVPPGTPGAIP